MAVLTTTVLIFTVVGYLAKKLKDNKSIDDFFSDFTEATVNWIKPIFLEADQPKDVLIDLKADPEEELNQQAAANAIAKALKKNPAAVELLHQMVEVIEKKDPSLAKANTIGTTGSENKTYQDLNDSSIVDQSNTQTHSGSGDNVGGDKINRQINQHGPHSNYFEKNDGTINI